VQGESEADEMRKHFVLSRNGKGPHQRGFIALKGGRPRPDDLEDGKERKKN